MLSSDPSCYDRTKLDIIGKCYPVIYQENINGDVTILVLFSCLVFVYRKDFYIYESNEQTKFNYEHLLHLLHLNI